MAGKPNEKWLESMIRVHGSREAVTEFMQSLGRKGGKKGTTGGFASTVIGADGLTGRQRASKVGVFGGRKSRKGAKNEGA